MNSSGKLRAHGAGVIRGICSADRRTAVGLSRKGVVDCRKSVAGGMSLMKGDPTINLFERTADLSHDGLGSSFLCART